MKKSIFIFLFGMFSTLTALAQSTVVKGSVKDAVTDEPIPNVTITVDFLLKDILLLLTRDKQ